MDRNNRFGNRLAKSLVNGIVGAVLRQKSYIKSLPLLMAGILVTFTLTPSTIFAVVQPPGDSASIDITSLTPEGCQPVGTEIAIEGTATAVAPPGDLDQYAVKVVWGDGNEDIVIQAGDFGDGHGTATLSFNGTHTYSAGGNYTITAIIYHANGEGQDNVDSDSVDVCVASEPSLGGLTVIKQTIGGDGTFSFNGTTPIGDFQITTDQFTGSQIFVDLAPGTYIITEDPLPDWEETSNTCASVEVTAGEQISCTIVNTFSQTPPPPPPQSGSISGYKFNDLNGNGEWDEPDEPGIADWEILLHNRGDEGSFNDVHIQTEQDGSYTFAGLDDGVYEVCEVISEDQSAAGWTMTYPESGCHIITIDTDTELTSTGNNFGNHQDQSFCTGSIDGRVFDDQNENGALDAGEPGLAGIVIYLDIDNDNALSEGDVSTETGANGLFHFSNRLPGVYTVREVVPNGWHLIYPGEADEGEYVITVDCESEFQIMSFDLMIQAISGSGSDVNFANAQDPTSSGGGSSGSRRNSDEEVRGEQSTGVGSNEEVKGEQTLPVTGASPIAWLFTALLLVVGWRELHYIAR